MNMLYEFFGNLLNLQTGFLSSFIGVTLIIIAFSLAATLIVKIPFIIFQVLEHKREQAITRLLNEEYEDVEEVIEQRRQKFKKLSQKRQSHVNFLVTMIVLLSMLVILPSTLVLIYEFNFGIWPTIILMVLFYVMCIRQTIRCRQ